MGNILSNIKKPINKTLDRKFVMPTLIVLAFAIGCLTIYLQKPVLSLINFALFVLYILLSSGKNNLILILCTFVPSPLLITPESLPLTLTSTLFLVYLARVAFQYTRKQDIVAMLQSNFKLVAIYLIFVIYAFLITIVNSGLQNIVTAVSFCLYSALPIFAVVDKNSNKSLNATLNYLTLIHLASLFIALGFLMVDPLRPKFDVYYVAPKDGDFVILKDRFYGFCADPNELSMITIIITSFVFFGYKFSSKKQITIVLSTTLAIMLLTALTQSKSYLICVALLIFMLFIKTAYYRPTLAFATVFAVCGLVSVSLAILGIGPVAAILSRFLSPNMVDESFWDTITTGRVSIWADYLRILCANPAKMIFGQGVRSMYYARPDGLTVAHNAIINYVWELGIIGTFLYIYMMILMLARPKNKPKSQFKWLYFPLVLFIIFSFGLTVTANLEVQMIIILTISMARQDYEPKTIGNRLQATWVLKERSLNI